MTLSPFLYPLSRVQANVMMEYSVDEAIGLMQNNLQATRDKIRGLQEDLDYLKDQIVISEVNIARIHNYTVFLNQQQKV